MKYFFCLTFLFLTCSDFGQNKKFDPPKQDLEPLPDLDIKMPEPTIDTVIKVIVSYPASFQGGHLEMKKFIADKVKNLNPKLSGTVGIRVVVELNGTLTNLKIIKNIPDCSTCDLEASNIIKSMPKWTPAEHEGRPVRSYYNIPIKFDP